MNARFWSLALCIFVAISACSSAPATPTVTPTPLPTLVPSDTPAPPKTATPAPTASPTLVLTPTPTSVQLDPLTGVKVAPPLDITLPDDWKFGYDTIAFQEVGEVTYVPIALYQGPVTGGEGTIVLVWNFRSITAGNPFQSGVGTPNLYVDGLRLLRSLVFDPRCNIGTDLERDYRVGGLPATGTQYSAVTCPDTPDSRGWFAGLNVNGVNFVFYTYTDPIDAMRDNVPADLQAILDSVVFSVPAP